MFSFTRREVLPKPVGDTPRSDARYKAWCILPDGRVGYIDHYKWDGRFGVRPVEPNSGKHFPNPSPHWNEEDRRKWPEELALHLSEIRAATNDELPRMYRL